MPLFVERSSLNLLVINNILFEIPFLLDVLKVSSKLFPAGITFCEGKLFPQLLIKKLIYRTVAVYSSTGILNLCKSTNELGQ